MINAILSKTTKGLRATMSRSSTLNTEQKKFLSAIDGKSTSREILISMGRPEDPTFWQLILTMVDEGYVRTWPPVAGIPTENAGHKLHHPADPSDLDFTGTPSDLDFTGTAFFQGSTSLK